MIQRITRRQLSKLALATAAASVAKPSQAVWAPDAKPQGFPAGFRWGSASAAYQVEGAIRQDGRGVSIWDTFAHASGKVAHNATGDVADDEFHRYKQDIALLREFGIRSYRFSVSWPRIFPSGSGKANAAGLAYYDRLVDELLSSGIDPFCTLYHWDLPQALQDNGGWQNIETAHRFADYAAHVSAHLSDRVKHFMTLNEIRTFTEHGYQQGTHAPGLQLNARDLAQVKHHALLAHGLGVQAIRSAAKPGTKVGLAENPAAATPVLDSAENIEAAAKALREENAAYLTAIMEGAYTDSYLQGLGNDQPHFTAEEMRTIASPLDFVGLNIYQPTYVLPAENALGYSVVEQSSTFPRMLSPWLTIGPECLYWTPRLAAKVWNLREIYITENGASAADNLTENGQVLDIDRVMYLRNYLTQLQRAVQDSVPIKGYFLWSLLDNYEWADGYEKRFGLIYVDFATQKRTPKLSAQFYKHIIHQNRIA